METNRFLMRSSISYLFALFLCGFTISGQASELIFENFHYIYNGGAAPSDIVAADFDNDGDQDFAINKAYYVKVFLNPGNGVFSSDGQLINTGSEDVKALHVNDLNGDGYQDIVAISEIDHLSGNLHILFNDGNGGFSDLRTYPVPHPYELSSGDFDGDGDVDLVLVNGLTQLRFIINQGSLGFTFSDLHVVSAAVYHVDVSDVNSDGWPDIALGHTWGTTVMTNGGYNVLTDGVYWTSETYPVDATRMRVRFGDLNTDGHVDLVLGTDGINSWGLPERDLLVMLNDATGYFESASTVDENRSTTSLAIADLDGDGDNDIARYVGGYPIIDLYENDGSAQFVRGTDADGGHHASNEAMAVADFNGDGFHDLITAGSNIHIAVYVVPNLPPIADAGGPYLLPVGGQILLDGSDSYDPDGDPLIKTWTTDGGTVSGDFLIAGILPGVFEVQLVVNDGTIGSQPATTTVVIYDPDGGFVTGGGWIDSPEGTYGAEPTLTGKATFGFVSKYKKGAPAPIGETKFQFKVADLNFHSSSYDWLVVTGRDYAMFKGSGTINGIGDYKFMLWAGDVTPDTFRIRIWTEDEVTAAETDVYDNGFDQAIGGGSIVIHKK